MSAFLITGLPRSRTAWMSVLACTMPGVMCWHEPMARFRRWECCFDLWKDPAYAHVGISDAHLGFHLEQIVKEVNPRILVIRRALTEVKESLAKLTGARTNYCDLLAAALERQLLRPGSASVGFDSLRNPAIVVQCLQYLIPGCQPDENKIRQLIELNIQADMELVWQRALDARADAHKILGADQMPGLSVWQ